MNDYIKDFGNMVMCKEIQTQGLKGPSLMCEVTIVCVVELCQYGGLLVIEVQKLILHDLHQSSVLARIIFLQ